MEVVTSDGLRLHVEVAGEEGAPPLLFSNSLGTRLEMWDGQMTEALRRYRVIRYDTRGHGRSDVPGSHTTLERLGEDVLDILDALGVERTRFCGLSLGGMTGMWLGVHAPERIERLVLANTSPHVPPASIWDERIRIAESTGMADLAETVVGRWFTAAFRERHPEAVEPIRRMLLETPPAGYAACCAAIRDMDQQVSIATIKLPTLVIVGEHDPATPPGHGELIHQSIEGSEIVTIADAAHLSNIEHPRIFNEAVFRFLAG